jgi:hypothetical protein
MSFDLFIGSFADGEPAQFPLNLLRKHFGSLIADVTPQCFVLRFGPELGDTCDLYVDTAAQAVNGFCISRPRDDARLFAAVFAVLQEPGFVLYMSSDCPPLVGNPKTAERLPIGMVEDLGRPVLLSSAAEIPARISES